VILRIVLALVVINLGYLKLTTERERWITSLKTLKLLPAEPLVKTLGVTQIIGSLLLIVGAYTQLVAFVFAVIFVAEAYFESENELFFKRDFVFYLLLATISISLMFLGAGFYAMDYPML
jgi:uncharacterized membrane protein YphA (DoxX/SURF4 family)